MLQDGGNGIGKVSDDEDDEHEKDMLFRHSLN
jgi:hypothetical protein